MGSKNTSYDVFISYAWSESRKEWVHWLAAQLHLIGFSVGYDGYLGYGLGLDAFMQSLQSARHVLIIMDDVYLQRMEKEHSGVHKESERIQQFLECRPEGWVGIIAIDNPDFVLPAWARRPMIKCFDFNLSDNAPLVRSALILEDLWRWCADLPVDKANAQNPAIIAKRLERIERIEELRDPAHWSYPQLEDTVEDFQYPLADGRCKLGYGDYAFTLQVSECGAGSVYVYSDPIKAVWLLPPNANDDFDTSLRSDRYVKAGKGQSIILMNEFGCLCKVDILEVRMRNGAYNEDSSSIAFKYHIYLDK